MSQLSENIFVFHVDLVFLKLFQFSCGTFWDFLYVNDITKTIENKPRWEDKSGENYGQQTTRTDCNVMTNLGYCEMSDQLRTPSGAPNSIKVVCFMHYTLHINLHK